MEITNEKIKGLYDIYGKLNEQKEIASELLRTAKDRYQHRTVEIDKGDGSKTIVREKFLWDEVFYLGMGENRATKVLEARHPKVFAAYKKQNEIAEECNRYVMANFGIQAEKITMADIFNISESMVRFLLSGQGMKISKKTWFDRLKERNRKDDCKLGPDCNCEECRKETEDSFIADNV
jgi:hypothetical protein